MIRSVFRRLLAATMALVCLTSQAHAEGRPLTIRDAVSMSSFGLASIDPGERWLVYERRGPYDEAPRYDMIQRSAWLLGELWIAAADGSGPPQRLLARDEGPGLLLGDWSPDGDRLLIYRLRGERLEAGVVSMSDRSVWWTGLASEWGLTGAVAAWIDDDRLGLVIHPNGELPYLLRQPGSVQRAMPARWEAQKVGREPSRTVIDTVAGVASTETAQPVTALVRIDVSAQRIVTVTEGPVRDWSVSPDGATLAVLKAGEGLAAHPDRVTQMAPLERGRLELIDLTSGRRRSLDARWDVAGQLLRWTKTSDALLIWVRSVDNAWADGQLARVTPDGGLTIIDRGGLAPLRPGAEIDHLSGVKADWMGATPVLYARRADGTRFDWYALEPDRSPRILTGDLAAPPARLSAISRKGLLLFADGGLWEAGGAHPRRLSRAGSDLNEGLRPDRMIPVRLRVNTPPRRDWVSPGKATEPSPGSTEREDGRLSGPSRRRLKPSCSGQVRTPPCPWNGTTGWRP